MYNKKTNGQFRLESDSMGEMKVPKNAYWAAQTQRAVENFPVSGIRFSRSFVRALGLVKLSAAKANMALGDLDKKRGNGIVRAATEVIDGKLDAHFVLDIYQTGSGTSSNMNANEVIMNRANEFLGGKIGDKKPVHPNDHVNMGQSSNDVIPTCMHVAALEEIEKKLLPALKDLQKALEKKVKEYDKIMKIGRTHLMDATPLRLGQEFSGYASMVKHDVMRLEGTRAHLSELALGGTAVGTGINRRKKFPALAIKEINKITGLKFVEAENHFEAQGAKDAIVEASSALKTVAVSLIKIANDIRFLGSGPRCGIGELSLPAVQPGSSIMPGKVNPVMAESLVQVCAQVIGNDAAVSLGGAFGNFELNVMMPMMTHNILQSIELLSNVVKLFNERCIAGLKANKERCEELVEKSLAMVTSLAPVIGYDNAAKLAKESHATGKTVRELCIEKKVLPEKELAKLLDPWSMTEPGGTGAGGG